MNDQITDQITYKKMEPAAKGLLVAALRSGGFKQGVGSLRPADNRFCCLGVACVVLGREGEWITDEDYPLESVFHYYGTRSSTSLPRILSEEIDLSMTAQNKLMEMNDAGRSFAEIADWTEENL